MKNIIDIKNIEELNYYLRNLETITYDEWVQLTNIASSITGLNKEDVENKTAWLMNKTE